MIVSLIGLCQLCELKWQGAAAWFPLNNMDFKLQSSNLQSPATTKNLQTLTEPQLAACK